MAENLNDSSNNFNEKIIVNQRVALYKKPIKKNNYKTDLHEDETPQEIRRQRLLCEQKRNRDATFNSVRGLLDEILKSDDENNEEAMEVQQETKDKRYSKRAQSYANQLMLSEWMLEVPPDLLEKWLMVPCPEGRRTLLIASKGATKAYNKRGVLLGKFSSALPGGTYQDYRNSCTILDCIWIKETKTYYTLDVLAWSNQPLLDCDTEFRFFWLKTRLEETEGLKDRGSSINNFPILSLPNYSCDSEASVVLGSLKSLHPLDGLLFYHREAHYKHGRSPLVNWLKPFMLPDVLGDEFFTGIYEKPADYVNVKSYIRKNRINNRKGRKKDDLMETEENASLEEMAELFML